MRSELAALQRGGDFDVFVRKTRPAWHRLAAFLCSRWQTPTTVTVEDVVQEMLIEAWLAVPEWDATRGVAVDRFVVFRACATASRWIHRQRHARKLSARSPSRHAIPASALGRRHDPDAMFELPETAVEATVEADLDCRRRVVERLSQLSPLEREVALALLEEGGSVSRVACRLLASGAARVALRLDSHAAASRVVRRTVTRLEENEHVDQDRKDEARRNVAMDRGAEDQASA